MVTRLIAIERWRTATAHLLDTAMRYLPTTAYRASVYADWTDATFCTVSACRYVNGSLPEVTRKRSIAAASITAGTAYALPHYLLPDTFGSPAYSPPRQRGMPAYSPLAAMLLDCCQRLRRWRYYGDSPD